ncbi:LacI family DNA-binding transcriptional regulator [Paenibacillus sacheonensis]|uniref:Substrate-binding domain-containing protein n=1 Tax=Paenibacillus sacheonensis TaxID=742054 RepID=A0A7X4YL56_9BACL|nr:LacI family DNA-binding transcriptional regulator [Paenibacillus sacheonensis]MBM7564243.1 LacI family transcriptional regulator [Paenibacillus sacheonensis]NBC67434.1 substrate-binding domain-containing protein [Paenibacillus sacheonensis]
MVTLKDIAKKANVSVTTISKVVNHHDTSVCSEETQQLIWSLVAEMGYRTRRRNDRGAAANAAPAYRMAYVIGMPNYALSGTYTYQIIQGIETEAFKRGVSMVFTCMNLSLYSPRSLCDKLREMEVSAVIWVAGSEGKYFSMLKQHDIHVVVAGIEPDLIPDYIDYVGINFYADTLHWLRTAVFNRFADVGYIGPSSQARFEAYRDIHLLLGLTYREECLIDLDEYDVEQAKAAVTGLVKSGTKLPEVFFAASDAIGIGALNALQSMGIAVPGQVRVFGFDNIDMANYVSPGLTTIGVPAFQIGAHAVNAALSKMKGERDYTLHHIFPTRFVERDSL